MRVDRVEKEDKREKKDDSKTPSEYALHILFTQVSTTGMGVEGPSGPDNRDSRAPGDVRTLSEHF